MGQKLEKVVNKADTPDIHQITTADNQEYQKLKLQIEDRARDVIMGKEKVDAFNGELDSLSAWISMMLEKHRDLGAVAVEADALKEQLLEHQVKKINSVFV